jgi:adenylate cyclase
MVSRLKAHLSRSISVPALIALFSAVLSIILLILGVLDNEEWNTYNWRCRWRGERWPGEGVFLLVVDEGILQSQLGTFPWPRKVWASIQEACIQPLEPHSVVYDIVFDQQDKIPDSDEEFERVIRESGNVLLANNFLQPTLAPVSATEAREYNPVLWRPPSRSYIRQHALNPDNVQPGEYYHGTALLRPYQSFERVAAGLGHTNTPPDTDGITRRLPLIMEYMGQYYPSLPLVAVCHYLELDIKTVRVKPGGAITIPVPGREPISIPIDKHANMLLNYYGEDLGVFPSLSMKRFIDSLDAEQPLLRARAQPERLTGKIVIIGSAASSTHDLRAVTVSQLYPLMGNIGTAVANILQGDYLYKTNRWIDSFLMILLAGLMAGSSQRFQQQSKHLLERLPSGFLRLLCTALVQLVPFVLLAVAYSFICFFTLAYFSQVLPMYYGVFCLLITFISLVLYNFISEEQNKRWFEQTWGRYMSPAMIQELRENPEQLNLGGEEREITVLFTDISGFTTMSERLSPREIVQLLNEYFDSMVESVLENRGMLDKYIGDAMMVHFGSPRKAPDDALRAVRSGCQMQMKLRQLSEKWEAEGKAPIGMRVGINTGMVVAGNIGSALRQEYTAIGDTVNVAQRLESNCPIGGVLISRMTWEQVNHEVEAEPLEPLHVKGRRQPVETFLVNSVKLEDGTRLELSLTPHVFKK